MVVDVLRPADLQDAARVHHRDPVRHGQRLFLIVGDEDEGDAGFRLKALQFDLHFLAQLEIQRRKRLIQQQHLGPRRQGPRQRDALLLTAGNLARGAVRKRGHLHQLQHFADRLLYLALGPVLHLKPETDILGDGHVREQRIILKNGIHGARIGRR